MLVLVVLLLGVTGSARAQESAPAPDDATPLEDDVRAVSAAHERTQRAHLWRVAAWGGANVALGTGLMLATRRSRHPARFGYGLQSGLWGAINVGIAGLGLRGGAGSPVSEIGPALESVRGYHDILLLNMGLNVAYAGVGAAMLYAGTRDVRGAASWRGHGAALIVQGVGLFVLDGVTLWSARARLSTLIDLAIQTTLSMGPEGVHLLVRF